MAVQSEKKSPDEGILLRDIVQQRQNPESQAVPSEPTPYGRNLADEEPMISREEWKKHLAYQQSLKERAMEPFKSRGITQENWLQHLDELTDEEITYLLDQEPGKERLDEERKADPNISDRTRAEFMRDF